MVDFTYLIQAPRNTMTPLLLLNAKFPINCSSQNDLDIKVLKRIIYYFND